MDIVGLLRKERLALMGKVNAVDAALRLLSLWWQCPTSES
jgi:hypothetical protein